MVGDGIHDGHDGGCCNLCLSVSQTWIAQVVLLGCRFPGSRVDCRGVCSVVCGSSDLPIGSSSWDGHLHSGNDEHGNNGCSAQEAWFLLGAWRNDDHFRPSVWTRCFGAHGDGVRLAHNLPSHLGGGSDPWSVRFVVVHDIGEPASLHLDIPSLILLILGLVGFVYGLSEITVRPAVAAGISVLGLAILAVFVRRQFVVQNPVLNLKPMTSSRFWPSAILVVVAMMTTFSLSVLLPLYFQGSLGMTALAAGALLLAPILVNAVTAVVGGKVMDSRGPWPLLAIGFGIIVVGQLGIHFFAPHLSWLGVLGASVLSFGGVGLVLSPSQTAGLSTLSKPEYPHGVALLNTFIQVAASIGPSLLIGILASGATSREKGGASAAQANADGFALAILVAAVIAAVGAVVAVLYSRMLASEEAQVDATAEPTIASLMQTEVFSVLTTAAIGDVVTKFISAKTTGLPTVDDKGRVHGYITDGDILRAVAGRGGSSMDLAFGLNVYPTDPDMGEGVARVMQLGVMELASTDVVTANVEDSVEDVAALLGARPINKVPVLSGEAIVGVITRGDLVRNIFGSLVAGQNAGD